VEVEVDRGPPCRSGAPVGLWTGALGHRDLAPAGAEAELGAGPLVEEVVQVDPGVAVEGVPARFGRRPLGAITSNLMMWIVWGSALGPSLLAISQILTGDYRLGLQAGSVISAAALALACIAKPPPQQPRPR